MRPLARRMRSTCRSRTTSISTVWKTAPASLSDTGNQNMPTTITVPVIGPAPTVRSRVFLDPHGAEYVGVGRQKRTHVVALVAGVVQKVSGDAATIQLFESHP